MMTVLLLTCYDSNHRNLSKMLPLVNVSYFSNLCRVCFRKFKSLKLFPKLNAIEWEAVFVTDSNIAQ